MTTARSLCQPARLVRAATFAAVLLGIAWAIPDPALADDVTLIPGSKVKAAIGGRVRGAVQNETPTEVVVTLGSNTTSVPTDQIVSIRYDGQSANYQLGESRESAGQYAEAAEYFKKAAADTTGKPFPHQAALFREARALADVAMVEPARVKEARTKLEQFLRSYAGGRHVAAARETLARLLIQAGDFTAAETTVAALAKTPKGSDRAAVLHTKILARQGKHAEAIAELDQIIASSAKGSERRRGAMLAKAESLAATKKYKEAEALVREVIQANPPEDAASQAPAYNTLGDCLRAANKPKEALIAYLHTDMLYRKNREEHPRSLYEIAAMFRILKQDSRADEFTQRLKQEYPRSPWNNRRSSAGE